MGNTTLNTIKNVITVPATWLSRRQLLIDISLPALTTLFGLQMLRVFIPGMYLGFVNRLSLTATTAIAVIVITVLFWLTARFLPSIRRKFGTTSSVVLMGGCVGLIRLLMLLWYGDPIVEVVLAILGTIMFTLFLILYIGASYRQGNNATLHFSFGLLVGLILDTTLHGALLTYDLVWQSGPVAILLTVIPLLAQWLLLYGVGISGHLNNVQSSVSAKDAWVWLAIGPFLFLQLLVLQNVARLAALTKWSLPSAFAWTLLAQLVALVAAVWLVRQKMRILWPLALSSGAVLIATTLIPRESWITAAITLLAGQISATLLIALVAVDSTNLTPIRRSFTAKFPMFTGVVVLLILFVFGYYIVYQFSLFYDNSIFEPAAAAVLTGCALFSCIKVRQNIQIKRGMWLVPIMSAVLLIVPIINILIWQEPKPIDGNGFPTRVMTYNLHYGANTEGKLDIETLAQVIEKNQPDIVALQEVSRGWLIGGRVDVLAWLSQRLNMPYVFGPAADPLWGNAILSRYPIKKWKNYDLPPRDLAMLRSFLWAELDLGGGSSLEVIVTHFHQLGVWAKEDCNNVELTDEKYEGSEIRVSQSKCIIEFWNGSTNTVILGDLNAEPCTPEMVVLRDSGLWNVMVGQHREDITVSELVDMESKYYTTSTTKQHLDYIWISPDLKVTDAYVYREIIASDHVPVVAVISEE